MVDAELHKNKKKRDAKTQQIEKLRVGSRHCGLTEHLAPASAAITPAGSSHFLFIQVGRCSHADRQMEGDICFASLFTCGGT